AFTLATVPRTSPAFTTFPTFGSSTYTTSVSSDCAKSVIPIVARFPTRRDHSWSFVYRRVSGMFVTGRPALRCRVPDKSVSRGLAAPALVLRAPCLVDPDVLVRDLPDVLDRDHADEEHTEA